MKNIFPIAYAKKCEQMKTQKQIKEETWYRNKRQEEDHRDEQMHKLMQKQHRNELNVQV